MFCAKDEQTQSATCAGVSDSLIGCPSKRKRIEPIFTPCEQQKFTFHRINKLLFSSYETFFKN